MREPPSRSAYQSIHRPQKAFKLCMMPVDFDPMTLANFKGHEVPDIFGAPFIDFLLKVKGESGFARLHIQTKIHKKSPKTWSVECESSSSERDYINASDFKMPDFHEKIFFQDS